MTKIEGIDSKGEKFCIHVCDQCKMLASRVLFERGYTNVSKRPSKNKKCEVCEKEEKEEIIFPSKKYQIIYADPPWSYRDKALAGNRGAGCKYQTQSKDWIDNLPVERIVDVNCVLFLWVTMPKLNECWELIEKWGFDYKTVAFTWVKRNKKSNSWFWGIGQWTRANAELCLLAVRGKPRRISASVHSVVDASVEEHSKKPNEVRKRIVELVGDLPRIELFARQKVKGWDVWGNEV